MKVEHQICIALKGWFESYEIQCWLNEGEDRFKTKHSQKKPDLLIFSKRLNQFVALEVKKGDVSKDVHDSGKIINYWEMYKDSKIKYFIKDIEIKISSFAVSTSFSIYGRLFKNEDFYKIDKNDKWKITNKKYSLEPKHEYQRTHDFLRNLWSQWRRLREREPWPGLGIVVCNTLNSTNQEKNMIGNPLLFDMQWEDNQKKPQWRVRQKLL